MHLALILGAALLASPPVSATGVHGGSEGDPFDPIARVLLSPRCRNCHPAGDVPLQHDAGTPHAMEVSRAAMKLGLTCGACHLEQPLEDAGPGMPPGAPHWGLPPEHAKMPFEGRTPAQLCEQLKDPAQTNGKDLEELLHHVSDDALVKWAWTPGEDRTSPPLSHPDFVAAFSAWVTDGAPCPSE